MPQLLPRFYRAMQQLDAARRLAKAILEDDDQPDGNGSKPLRRSADGHDPARLRGLPAIGRNVSGAIRGTDPLRALLNSENGRRRR